MMPFNPMMGPPPNKKKPGELIQNIKPLLKELMAPRWPRLVIGLVLVMIGRAAGLVAPASTRFLVDDIIGKFDVPTPLDQRFETSGVEPVYFFGYVEYRDIFKRRHTSRFCALLKPMEGTSALAGERAWSSWD